MVKNALTYTLSRNSDMKWSLHKEPLRYTVFFCWSFLPHSGNVKLCLFKSIKTGATLKHPCWSREKLDTITELFYCARSHFQIITRMPCGSNYFFLYVWKNKILKDILPPNAGRASVVKATGVIN